MLNVQRSMFNAQVEHSALDLSPVVFVPDGSTNPTHALPVRSEPRSPRRGADRCGVAWSAHGTPHRGLRPRCCEPHYKPNARPLLVVSHVARDAERIGAEWRGPRTALRADRFALPPCEPHYKPNARVACAAVHPYSWVWAFRPPFEIIHSIIERACRLQPFKAVWKWQNAAG